MTPALIRVNPIVEDRFLKTAHLAPGELLAEVSTLALIHDPEVDACCLLLLPSLDEPPLAEYWFGSFEQAERRAVRVFGARFVVWDGGDGSREVDRGTTFSPNP